MKKMLAIVLTLAVLVSLAACGGGNSKDPYVGKYLGIGKNYSNSAETPFVFRDNTWMELKSGGKGIVMLSGARLNLTWSAEGEALAVTIADRDSFGTLEDGLITIELLDMGEFLFLKEGMELPVPKVTYNDAGYWEMIRIESENPNLYVPEEYMELFRNSGVLMYMELKDDGTGVLRINEESDLTWKDGTVTLPSEGVIATYTLKDGEMVLELPEMTCILRAAEKP